MGPEPLRDGLGKIKSRLECLDCDQKGHGALSLVYLHGRLKEKEREVQNMHGSERSEPELEIQMLSNTFRGRNHQWNGSCPTSQSLTRHKASGCSNRMKAAANIVPSICPLVGFVKLPFGEKSQYLKYFTGQWSRSSRVLEGVWLKSMTSSVPEYNERLNRVLEHIWSGTQWANVSLAFRNSDSSETNSQLRKYSLTNEKRTGSQNMPRQNGCVPHYGPVNIEDKFIPDLTAKNNMHL